MTIVVSLHKRLVAVDILRVEFEIRCEFDEHIANALSRAPVAASACTIFWGVQTRYATDDVRAIEAVLSSSEIRELH